MKQSNILYLGLLLLISITSTILGQNYIDLVNKGDLPDKILPLIDGLKTNILLTDDFISTNHNMILKCVKVDIKSLVYLNPNDSIGKIQLSELKSNKLGNTVVDDNLPGKSMPFKIYTFRASIKDICTEEITDYHIGFRIYGKDGSSLNKGYDRCIYFNGTNLFYPFNNNGGASVNPSLTDNPDKYYMTWNEKTNCPLQILAYKIVIDENDRVNVGLIVRNASSKKIVGYKGIFKMYDKMNEPVTWGGSGNSFNFTSQDQTIEPNSQPIEVGLWELTLYDLTRRIRPSIYKIQFDDGKYWNQK